MSTVLLDTSVASLLHPKKKGSTVRAQYEPHMQGQVLAHRRFVFPQLSVLHRSDAQCGVLTFGGQECRGAGIVGSAHGTFLTFSYNPLTTISDDDHFLTPWLVIGPME